MTDFSESYRDRPSRPASVKRAISRAMKGKSNFEGKTHTKKSKTEIKLKRGTGDRIQGRKWSVDRETGETSRTYALPDDHKWGRSRRKSLKEWMEVK
jgi:hypothetical protein